jgi:regulator of sigma E protease
MQTINSILGLGGNLAFTIAAFLFVLTIVVFFHELGHFLAARWCGVRVQAFSIGFGREIFGFHDKHGTRWRFAWIPLGGYVKFMDDENAASVPSQETIRSMTDEERAGSFHSKPLWQKAFVVAAGPLANFILAIVILAGLYAIVGQRITAPLVDEIAAGSAAEGAGFKTGDRILSIDGTAIETFGDMQRIVGTSAEQELRIVVDRQGKHVTLTAVPKRDESVDRFGNKVRRGLLGVKRTAGSAQDWEHKRYGPIAAVGQATKETWFIVTTTMSYLKNIIIGRESADQLSGPIGIAKVSGQMATVGWTALIHLCAVLSVSIGLLNLFPVPMLDGGHLMFYGIEAVRQRPLSERTQEIGFRIGLALVLMLMIFSTRNDLRSWWPNIL